jgi:hypothetical protein
LLPDFSANTETLRDFPYVSNAWVQYLFYRFFLCLVVGVRVAKFDVGVNGVGIEMAPVLVYTN